MKKKANSWKEMRLCWIRVNLRKKASMNMINSYAIFKELIEIIHY